MRDRPYEPNSLSIQEEIEELEIGKKYSGIVVRHDFQGYCIVNVKGNRIYVQEKPKWIPKKMEIEVVPTRKEQTVYFGRHYKKGMDEQFL